MGREKLKMDAVQKTSQIIYSRKTDLLILFKRIKPKDKFKNIILKPVEKNPTPVHERKGVGVGYGYKYDEELTSISLQSPIAPNTHFLDDSTRQFFADTIRAPDRVTTELPRGEVAYLGPWYYQGLEPTCAPWAIANATLALGLKLNSALMTDLLNLANDIEKSEKGGLGFYKAKELTDQKYPQAEINLSELTDEERLEWTEDPAFHLFAFVKYETVSSMFNLPKRTQEELLREIKERNIKNIRKNAAIIKKTIDEGAKILASVSVKQYQGRDNGLHAISIVGYKVNENGVMNIQLIDSDRGILWISLEHLSKCIVPFNTYRIYKTTN